MSDPNLHRTVPGNRWDLVRDEVAAADPRSVAVIVPYYEQPESLARMYAALADLDPTTCSLVVADDGSTSHPAAPPPASFPLVTRVVTQPDRGRRAGAARNLGASVTSADVLVFLDADTVPAPGTVARLAAWPSALPDALVVGRRHHADLTGWTPAATMAWLGGAGPAPARRTDPSWLADGYRATHDLLDADERSYRFVISAVMACHRRLFDDLGGFDAERAEYGGEDWEFAARAYNNGAVLVHDPHALAWHDEPDWAEREGGSKNDETMWLAGVVAEPGARGAGVRHRHPELLVTLPTAGVPTGALVTTIEDLLHGVADARIHLSGPVSDAVARYVGDDGRVQTAPPTAFQCQRARARLRLTGAVRWTPCGLRRALGELDRCGQLIVTGDDGRVCAELVTTRAAGRVARAGGGPELLATLFGRRTATAGEVELTPVDGDVDLAALFAAR